MNFIVNLLILLPAKALAGVSGLPPRDAVFLAGAWVCPVLHACCAVAAAWAARALWTGVGPLFAGLLVAGNPAALSYSAAGRADHHTPVPEADAARVRAVLDTPTDAPTDTEHEETP